MKRFLQTNKTNILLLIGSCCISILAAELVMRLIYVPQPVLELGNFTPWHYNDNYTPPLNQYGFREEDVDDIIFEDGFTRILFLGDSFTFGQGIEKGEHRFSDIIERRLNSAEQSAFEKYHIYNAGVSGSAPKNWSFYLDQAMSMYKPDYVFAIFFLRDGTDVCTSLRCHEEVINEIKTQYTGSFFYKYTTIGRYLSDTLIQKEFSSYYTDQLRNAYLGREQDKTTWLEQQHFLFKMQDVCQQNGIEFHLILFPVLYDLDSNYLFYEVEAEIIRFADRVNTPVFSLTPGFIGQKSQTLWVSPNDQHPNEKGHQIAADTLYPYLEQIVGH